MIFVIACIYNKTKLAGFRLYDTNARNTMEISYDKLYNGIARGIKVENIQIDGDKLKGKGGSINRYTPIDMQGYIIGEQSVVVVNKQDEDGISYYTVIDYAGNREDFSSNELVKFLYCGKIANGKVVFKNGKYIISAIEGEFNTQKLERIPEYVSRYNIPKLEKDRVDCHYLDKDEFKQRIKTKYNWSLIKSKVGICRSPYSYGKKTNEAYHDILRINNEKDLKFINILEMHFSTTKLFKIEIPSTVRYSGSNSSYLAYDIIHIGKNVVSLSVKNEATELEPGESTIIALGILGVIVINYDTQLTVDIIPYNKIEGQFELDVLMSELNVKYPNDLLNCITKIKQISPYKLNFDINKSDIPCRRMYNNVDIFETDGALSVNRLGIHVVTQIGTMPSIASVPNLIAEALKNEIFYGMTGFDLAYFSNYERPLFKAVGNPYERFRIKEKDKRLYITWKNTEIKHIGYFALYRSGLVDYWNNSWIDSSDLLTVEKFVWGVDINNTSKTLEVYVDDIKIYFNIDKIKQLYDEDKRVIQEQAVVTNRVRNKTRILGTAIELDDAGNIIEWYDSIYVKASSNICGIAFNDRIRYRSDNILTIEIARNDFNITDKTSGYATFNNVILHFKRGFYEESLRLLKDEVIIKAEYDLNEATVNEIRTILGILIRDNFRNRAKVVNLGERSKCIDLNDLNIHLGILVNKANILYSDLESYNKYKQNNIRLVNKELVSKEIKDTIMKECFSNINTRGKLVLSASIHMIHIVINELCTEEEAKEYIEKLNKFLSAINKH